jgi:hypothetical protein
VADINHRLERLSRRDELTRRARQRAVPDWVTAVGEDVMEVVEVVAAVVRRHPGMSIMLAPADGRPGSAVIRVSERNGDAEVAPVNQGVATGSGPPPAISDQDPGYPAQGYEESGHYPVQPEPYGVDGPGRPYYGNPQPDQFGRPGQYAGQPDQFGAGQYGQPGAGQYGNGQSSPEPAPPYPNGRRGPTPGPPQYANGQPDQYAPPQTGPYAGAISQDTVPTQYIPAQPGPGRSAPPQSGTGPAGPAQGGLSQGGSAQDGLLQAGPATGGLPQGGSAQNGATRAGPGYGGPAQGGPPPAGRSNPPAPDGPGAASGHPTVALHAIGPEDVARFGQPPARPEPVAPVRPDGYHPRPGPWRDAEQPEPHHNAVVENWQWDR